MKPSEAMRLGATINEKGTGDFAYTDDDGNLYTCAIGALAVGELTERGTEYSVRDIDNVAHSWFDAYCYDNDSPRVSCPACNIGHGGLADVIANLNDDHGWTREQIADWLSEQGY